VKNCVRCARNLLRAPPKTPVEQALAPGIFGLVLALGQRIQLESPALVPQPGIGVRHATHVNGRGVGSRGTHQHFNFAGYARRVPRCASPSCGNDFSVSVDVDLDDTNGK
jgi:hypothetical protein